MTALATSPLDIPVGVVLFVGCCAIALVALARKVMRWSAEEVERHSQAALATGAGDWGEPARAEVERPWLDEDAEDFWLDPMSMSLSQSRTAHRIRAQIEADHNAEVERFRRELEGWGGEA